MRLPTTLLARLAGTTLEGAELGTNEMEMTVPAVVQPVIELPLPIKRFTGFDNTVNQADSFLTFKTTGLAASQATLSTTICKFKRGLWRLRIMVVFEANFTQTLDGSAQPQGTVELLDPVPTSQSLISFPAVIVSPQSVVMDVGEIEFPEDGWAIRTTLLQTGVGNTEQMTIHVYAARLQ